MLFALVSLISRSVLYYNISKVYAPKYCCTIIIAINLWCLLLTPSGKKKGCSSPEGISKVVVLEICRYYYGM